MFDLKFTKNKKVKLQNDKRLFIDFDNEDIEKPKSNEFIIGKEKLKETIKKPSIKRKQPKKGKKLF